MIIVIAALFGTSWITTEEKIPWHQVNSSLYRYNNNFTLSYVIKSSNASLWIICTRFGKENLWDCCGRFLFFLFYYSNMVVRSVNTAIWHRTITITIYWKDTELEIRRKIMILWLWWCHWCERKKKFSIRMTENWIYRVETFVVSVFEDESYKLNFIEWHFKSIDCIDLLNSFFFLTNFQLPSFNSEFFCFFFNLFSENFHRAEKISKREMDKTIISSCFSPAATTAAYSQFNLVCSQLPKLNFIIAKSLELPQGWTAAKKFFVFLFKIFFSRSLNFIFCSRCFLLWVVSI